MNSNVLPHFVRSHRYAGRLMTAAEFQARDQLAALRSALPRAGAMTKLSATAVSMNLTNRIRVEFGQDADGFIPADQLDAATVLLIELHAMVRSLPDGAVPCQLRDWMKEHIGGSYPFPRRKRTKRRMKPNCWWYEYGESNVH